MATSRVLVIPLNEYGRRIGEQHHNARISDATVDLIREMHEDDGQTCRFIAETLQIRWATVRKIVYYQRRAQTPVKWRRIRLTAPASVPQVVTTEVVDSLERITYRGNGPKGGNPYRGTPFGRE